MCMKCGNDIFCYCGQNSQKIDEVSASSIMPGCVFEDGMKLDKFHFHEIIDRGHLICSMIDDFLIEHPGMTVEMNKQCEEAQQLLCNGAGLASAEKDRIFGI